ncbi:cellulase family glycosylhydrolase [Zavarzinella formosa]|uniref:cellulase family glycosylhydrolase n=1 Tax=Zavarzinella formosa TaxID=360055 RepID=UPI0002D46590|nr:cellulase family glycosylhydrolase [Zavarzinella formosa]
MPHVRLRLEELADRVLPAALPASLLVYYGYPSLIDDGDANTSPAQTFGRYDMVVLGAGLESPAHPDHANTTAIMESPFTAKTSFFGYVDLGVSASNFSLAQIDTKLDEWADMGVKGVLLDDFGYDYLTTRARQNAAIDYAHQLGLKVIANGFHPDDVFGSESDVIHNPAGLSTHLGASDYYLYESYQVSNGQYTEPGTDADADSGDDSIWGVKSAKIREYQRQFGFGTLGLSTDDGAATPDDPNQIAYAYLSAVTENFAGYGWGELSFSSADNIAPFHIRPTVVTKPVVITGTAGNDTVLIGPPDLAEAGVDVQVHVNGVLKGTYSASTPFTINLLGGNDTLTVGQQVGADFIEGRGVFGKITANGGAGNNSLTGGYGSDLLTGGGGNDTIHGSFGDDTLIAGAGTEQFLGGFGNDVTSGGRSNVTFDGGGGRDIGSIVTGTRHFTNVEVIAGQPPLLTINNPFATETDTTAKGTGYLKTAGNQILDQNNKPVKLTSENWYGAELNGVPEGLGVRSYQDILDTIKNFGFNSIRLPFALQTFAPSTTAASVAGLIDGSKNPDLVGLTPLRIFDKIIDYAGSIGLRVVLDCHRSSFPTFTGSDTGGPNPNGLWYDGTFSEDDWVAAWQMLATRYAGNTTVIGMDLSNEPHAVGSAGAVWDDGPGNRPDWRLAAERAGNAILAINPNLLIVVEGVGSDDKTTAFYGANLTEALKKPVVLNVKNRLVYSPHDYGISVSDQPWFHATNYPMNLYQVWNDRWGYLYWNNIAPIWLGEFGSTLDNTTDQQWYPALINYLSGDKNGDGRSDLKGTNLGMSWAHFAINPSANPGSTLSGANWDTPVYKILIPLQEIQATLPPAVVPVPELTFTVTLSGPSPTPVTVRYRTANGTATAGKDYLATSGTLTFAPGETSATVTVKLIGDTIRETNETVKLILSAPTGAKISSSTGTGTIIDDDNPTVPVQVANVVSTAGSVSFDIVLINPRSTDVNDWQLAFDAPITITSVAGAFVSRRDGDHYNLQSFPAANTVPAYGSVTIHVVAEPGHFNGLLNNLLWTGLAT